MTAFDIARATLQAYVDKDRDAIEALIAEQARAHGKRFRNCELHTLRNGRLVSVEVYFGWDLPHPAQPGGYVEPTT